MAVIEVYIKDPSDVVKVKFDPSWGEQVTVRRVAPNGIGDPLDQWDVIQIKAAPSHGE